MSQKCHFIGIGGIGMSGLARILLSKKCTVSGSDITTNYVTEGLIKEGAKVFVGQSEKNISPDMTIIYSSDIKKDNPEYLAALNLKCRMLHRADLLAELMKDYKALAIAGTHGKTTTTSLLITVLKEAGFDPAYAVGGVIPQLQSNAGHGEGSYFVAEADESDGSFLKYNPYGAIVTNIDNDHMDHYKSMDILKESFNEFLSHVKNSKHLFWCADDAHLTSIEPDGFSYGFNEGAHLHLSNYSQDEWSIRFDVRFQGIDYKRIEVALTGKHNALNAAAVFGLCLTLEVPETAIRHALQKFSGVGRRCEKKGEINGVLLLDDYAHHPTEISATLRAVRNAVKERRLVVVFQPHRYTRTKDCMGTYSGIFEDADEIIVTDIYAAGEKPIPGVTSDRVFNEIKESTRLPCRFVHRENLATEVVVGLRPHDVVIGLGAGDITKLSGEITAFIKRKPLPKWKIGVVFGGRSCEHEISILSAKNVLNMLGSDFYDVTHFGITKNGQWITGPNSMSLLEKGQVSQTGPLITTDVFDALHHCDVLFPVLHGPFGEDGTIQGFFEMIGKAYVGCDHRSSAVAMDKALTKKLMLLNGIPTSPYVDFSIGDWMNHSESILQQIRQQLTFPVFLKPVHLGSSIGVHKVDSIEELPKMIQKGFQLDDHLLVENGMNIREIEFSLLGNQWIKAYPPGEILSSGKVYDYDKKYASDGFKTSYKADLPPHQIEEGCELALLAFQAAGCCGMARVDTFLDQNNKFWLNEINPIPGFTNISLYPKMCEVNGLQPHSLADRLIVLALQRFRYKSRMG